MRKYHTVALRKESVDRNRGSSKSGLLPLVALRKESVDRNVEDYLHAGGLDVALRKESVDRNLMTAGDVTAPSASLSARRAWIEMHIKIIGRLLVASLSARRAWIEMPLGPMMRRCGAVALRKESVDRNQGHPIIFVSF